MAAILRLYQIDQKEELTAIRLSEIINVSRQHSQYLKAILFNEELVNFIRSGVVTTLELAKQLSPLKGQTLLNVLNESKLSMDKKIVPKKIARDKSKTAGRKRAVVSLGSTKKPFVAKIITETMLSTNPLKKYAQNFHRVDWTCLDQSTKAFQKLVEIMEVELGALV